MVSGKLKDYERVHPCEQKFAWFFYWNATLSYESQSEFAVYFEVFFSSTILHAMVPKRVLMPEGIWQVPEKTYAVRMTGKDHRDFW